MILFVGSYTEMITEDFGGHGDGIYAFGFNQETGTLTLHQITYVRNPSYLCVHRSKKLLYTVEEVFNGKFPMINAFHIGKDHSLELINSKSIPGGLPCHLEFINSNLVGVACYETAHIITYPISSNGSLLDASFVVQHQGKSINLNRQEHAHAHMIAPDSSGNVAICDLGMDAILIYELDSSKEQLDLKYTIKIPAGNGPRHIAYHPNLQHAFVLNELTGNITILKKINNQWIAQSTFDTFQDSDSTESAGSAIRVHPSGRFVYTGNRDNNSLAILSFEPKSGLLRFVGQQLTGGTTPREFILSPDGRWLLVANQDSDNLVVFKVDEFNGSLIKLIEYHLKSPVCLKWLEA